MGDLAREVDVAVVGGGPGGYAAAFRCAELGLETLVVDAAGRLGGACLFAGCIPSKALLHAAALMTLPERAREMGIDYAAPRLDLATLRAWKDERVVGRLARGLAGVAARKGVEVLAGRAVFEDSRALRVEGETTASIRFRHAVLATGSVAAPAPGVAWSARVLDPGAALELRDVPSRLLVLGGDYIAIELAQAYAALGSGVTLATGGDGLLPGVDRDLVAPLARRLGRQLEALRLGTSATGLRDTGSEVEASMDGQARETWDRVVVAVGREPVTDGLGLEATRVRRDDRGFVRVDERCRTTDPRVFAAGDVTGAGLLAHVALRQGKVAAEVIAGRAAAMDCVVTPAVVFSDPELAWCGLGEEAARAGQRPVRVASLPGGGSGRAATLGAADGLTKLVADEETGRLLGAGLVGPGAGELIAEAALAIEAALLAEDVALTLHAHPTRAETLMEVAELLLVRGTAPPSP